MESKSVLNSPTKAFPPDNMAYRYLANSNYSENANWLLILMHSKSIAWIRECRIG